MIYQISYKRLTIIFVLLGFFLGGPGAYLMVSGSRISGGILMAITGIIALIYVKNTLGGLISFMAGGLALVTSVIVLSSIFH